ncbi:hypothetical protein PHPALM_31241 [Phytophthora palmivora]|uniref:Uncharacterized protein n=1 Tax=Phytophthora palmivora TaxID=4796 RepID=A0A2P4X336_9STRA|nr:hypothetical protein PHPALM_31241 [Phytophthora palmivora]
METKLRLTVEVIDTGQRKQELSHGKTFPYCELVGSLMAVEQKRAKSNPAAHWCSKTSTKVPSWDHGHKKSVYKGRSKTWQYQLWN